MSSGGANVTIQQDEYFKAAVHGILLGCALPVLAYNLAGRHRQNAVNASVYAALIAFEVFHIVSHLQQGRP